MLYAPSGSGAVSTAQPSFAVAVRPNRSGVSVVLAGELDVQTVRQLDGEIESVRESGFNDIVVDLDEVTFIDSSGLRTLLSWARAAREEHFRFRITHGAAVVQRLLELTATHDMFEFVDRPAA